MRMMTHGIEGLGRGKGLTKGSYAMAIAQELAQSERWGYALDDMREEGALSERNYVSAKRDVEEKYGGERVKRMGKLSKLEKAVSYVIGISGIGLIISSGTGVTGNMLGNSSTNSPSLIAGVILLILGLVLVWRTFKK